MKKAALLTVIAFIALIGCATKYQPMGETGGFYHQQYDENFYMVGFNGNGFTATSQVIDFAYLRAAEIGEKLGYTHFVVRGLENDSVSSTMYMDTPQTTTGYVSPTPGGGAYFSGTSTGGTTPINVTKPRVKLGVTYFDGPPEGRHLEVCEVREVLSRIKKKHSLQ